MLHRFHVNGPFLPGETIELAGDELHHAAHVVRLRSGEAVEVFDGRGAAARAVSTEVTKQRVALRVEEVLDSSRELPFRVTLAAALIHPDKFELVLQKATELGVSEIIPVTSDRVEVRIERVAGKRERWERIVLEATKQSGRAVLPSIAEVTPFDALLRRSGIRLLFDADTPPQSLPRDEMMREGVTILIGPEGGWSDAELAAARDAGCIFQRLGARRLRAETASIAALVSVAAQLGAL